MSNLNMNWQSDGSTVYALNEQGVNDFSFNVQGNGRNGHDPKTLQNVVSMAKAAPDMYRALRDALVLLEEHVRRIDWERGSCRSFEEIEADGDLPDEILAIRAALAKADGEEQ